MKQATQTYWLSLTTEEFGKLTWEIMLRSNKTGNLQGFGRSIARWLQEWSAGDLPVVRLERAQPIEGSSDCSLRINVGLAAETTPVFRLWRTALTSATGFPITIVAAILGLVDCFLVHHLEENA